MNNFINWIAVNDTLLIRIGFTAVIVLIIVYVYRFFFMPKINNTVNDAQAHVSPEKSTIVENKPVEENAASFDLSVVTKKNEEIESLKAELAKLKVQVTDYEKEISDLKTKPEIQSSETVEAAETVEVAETAETADENATRSEPASIVSSNEEASNSDLVASLNTKIEQLESRLAEYEIIAEDISEISQLRLENAELKNKLAASSTVVTDSSEEPELPHEVLTEEPIVASASESASASNEAVNLVSEKDVTENEIEMMDQFENIATKKEGS